MGIIVEVEAPFMVTVADGTSMLVDSICKGVKYDIQGHQFSSELRPFQLGGLNMILGVDWLKRHSPVTFDYNKCTITLMKVGVAVTLKGISTSGSLQCITGKKLNKLMRSHKAITEGCICMITTQRRKRSQKL